ncbi:MAG: DUF721 domain-containing protein [Magnetococcus sp. DMHC-8]
MNTQAKMGGHVQIGTIVQQVAGRLLEQPRSKAQKLCWQWCQAAGEQIALHSEPARLANGVLTVRVDSPVWHSQLHHLKEELLGKMQQLLPPGSVRDLRFRQETLHLLPDWLRPPPPPPPLPDPCPEDVQRADALVAAVDDPEVREVLHRLLLTHMTLRRSTAGDDAPETTP